MNSRTLMMLIPLTWFSILEANPVRAFGQQTVRPKVGLALSGGGARGAAHIGVLKVLEQERIPIDYIAGTSIGALVGGLYAVGYSAEEIEKILVLENLDDIFDDSPKRVHAPLIQRNNQRSMIRLPVGKSGPELPTGFLRGQRLIEFITRYTAERMVAANNDFDRLPIPFRAVATDIITGRPYIFKQGSMAEALRASISIPAVFTAVEKDKMLLVDGGISNNLPCDVVKDMGADIIIAVDVTSPLYSRGQVRTLFKVLDQLISLMMKENVEENLKNATLVIRPDLETFSYDDYSKLGEIVARGVSAGREKSAEMHTLIPVEAISFAGPKQPTPKGPVIGSIEFEGLDKVAERKAREIIKGRTGNRTDAADRTTDLQRLIASGEFAHGDYTLEPAGEDRVRLKYRIGESAAQTLGLGIRLDQDYKFVVLGEFNKRRMFGTPSSATFSSQFGGLQNHSAGLRLVHPGFANFFLEPSVYVRRQERNDVQGGTLVDTFSDRRLGTQLVLGAVVNNRFEVSGGYQIQRVTVRGGTEPIRQNSRAKLAGLVLRVRHDTMDHQEFPNHGMFMNLQMDRRSKSLGSGSEHTIVQGDILRPIQLTEKSTVAIRAGGSFAKGALPFHERAYLGGSSFSEMASRHFVGFGKDELATRQFVLLGATYRRQIFSSPSGFLRRGYLTLDYNVVGSSESKGFMEGYKYRHGGGPGFSISTPFAPIRIGTGFGAGKPKLYFTIGPSF